MRLAGCPLLLVLRAAAGTSRARSTTSTRCCASTSSPVSAGGASPTFAVARSSRSWTTSHPPCRAAAFAVVNAIRSLYQWAQERELVEHDPAQRVRLPAMTATPIERVAPPVEFAERLAALALDDALPYALAGYGMGRRAQIVRLRCAG
jgi:hypothetical protein